MMLLDVYDFDHTLYDGDTIVDFWRFEVGRHPALLRFLPRQLGGVLRRVFRRCATEEAKSAFQCYFSAIDLDSEVAAFWQAPGTRRKLYDWYRERPRDLPRVVASASARPVIAPIVDQLPADALIATEVDAKTGRLLGKNCSGEEKLRAVRRRFPGCELRAMYTDSEKADGPLLRAAQERYLLRKGRIQRLP